MKIQITTSNKAPKQGKCDMCGTDAQLRYTCPEPEAELDHPDGYVRSMAFVCRTCTNNINKNGGLTRAEFEHVFPLVAIKPR